MRITILCFYFVLLTYVFNYFNQLLWYSYCCITCSRVLKWICKMFVLVKHCGFSKLCVLCEQIPAAVWKGKTNDIFSVLKCDRLTCKKAFMVFLILLLVKWNYFLVPILGSILQNALRLGVCFLLNWLDCSSRIDWTFLNFKSFVLWSSSPCHK